MAKYTVTVKYTMELPISVYASGEVEAEEKACDVVLAWKDVIEAEATDVTEE